MGEDGLTLRVIFLHGMRQNGDLLRSRLEPLTRRLARLASFHFPDAPPAAIVAPAEAAADVPPSAASAAPRCYSLAEFVALPAATRASLRRSFRRGAVHMILATHAANLAEYRAVMGHSPLPTEAQITAAMLSCR
jgi:hypothetical protein